MAKQWVIFKNIYEVKVVANKQRNKFLFNCLPCSNDNKVSKEQNQSKNWSSKFQESNSWLNGKSNENVS